MPWEWYLGPDGDRNDAFAAIDRAADYTDLPPAIVITAEFDPLRDEGEAYAKKLKDAGVPVELRRYDGVIHGFFSMGDMIAKGKTAVQHATGALRKAYGQSS